MDEQAIEMEWDERIAAGEKTISQFNIGDRVRLDDGRVGTLTDIGIAVYYVTQDDGGLIPVPHTSFAEMEDGPKTERKEFPSVKLKTLGLGRMFWLSEAPDRVFRLTCFDANWKLTHGATLNDGEQVHMFDGDQPVQTDLTHLIQAVPGSERSLRVNRSASAGAPLGAPFE